MTKQTDQPQRETDRKAEEDRQARITAAVERRNRQIAAGANPDPNEPKA